MDIVRPMLSTCGSGITASIVTMAAHLLNKEMPVYDVCNYCVIKMMCYHTLLCYRALGLNGYKQQLPTHVQNLSFHKLCSIVQ